jgi:membrane fusion protein (multidrug efflux system)
MMADDAGAGRALQTERSKPRVRWFAWYAQLSRPRQIALALGAAALLSVSAGLYLNWLLVGAHQVSTNNAYVKADISVVAAQVEGYVRALPVRENQEVRAGDVLVQIDPADYRTSVESARAAVARARAQAAANSANRAAAAAQLARSEFLAQRGLLSSAGLDSARAQAGQWSGSTQAALADIAAAEAQLAKARLDLERTTVHAPIAGIVGNRSAQVGQLVRPGAPLMAIVPHTLYVEANFKETQLARLRPGQSVSVQPDIDRSLRLHGVVDSLSPASGSEFSFIPTETATGNFTKIVQRVPVRIRLDASPEAHALLRPGLSVTVIVDTRPRR